MFNKKQFLTAIAVLFIGASISACETIEGAGEDLENAGQSVQRAAN